MARHGESKHFKRSVVTKAVVIPRKKYVYYVRSLPGKHRSSEGIALLGILRDLMKIAKNGKEARYLIRSGNVKVDGKIIKEEKYIVGFGDMLDVKGEKFLVYLDSKGKLIMTKDESDQKSKRLKVLSKGKAKADKTVLRLSDGRNVITDKPEIQIGDTIVLDLSKNKIQEVLPFEQGREVIIFRGKNAGLTGKITKIDAESVELEKGGKSFRASTTSCFVL